MPTRTRRTLTLSKRPAQSAAARRARRAVVSAMLIVLVTGLRSSPAAATTLSTVDEQREAPLLVDDMQTVPADGAVLNWPPRDIVATLPEATDPSKVTFELTDADGIVYHPAAESRIDGALVVFHPPTLPAGQYTFRWTGAVNGESGFTVSSFDNRDLVPLEGQDDGTNVDQGAPTVPRWLGYLPLALGFLSASLLLFRRRFVAAAVVVVAAAALTGVLTLVGTADRSPETSTLPCLPLTGEGRIECLADSVLARFQDGGVRAALTGLVEIGRDQRFRSEYGENVCHSVAHTAAREIVLRTGSLRAALEAGGTVCASGFLHGALEGGAPVLSNEIFAEEVVTVCGRTASVADLECAHGVGHAASLRLNARMQESALICRRLANTEQVTQCILGAAMLYGSWIGNTSARGAVVTPAGSPQGEIGEVCTGNLFTEIPSFHRACLEGIFQYLKSGPDAVARLPLRWRDLDEVARWCEETAVRRPELRVGCFASLGTASALRLWQDPASLASVCTQASTQASRRECVRALVTQVRNNSEDSPDLAVYERICEAVPADMRAGCVRSAKRMHGR